MVESAGVFHKFLPPLLVEFTHQDKIWQNDFAHLFSLRFSDILLVRELRKSLVKKKTQFVSLPVSGMRYMCFRNLSW